MSTNMFAYCENNPVMGYDPEGYWSKSHHRDITSKKGFKNKTVLNWVQLADASDPPCKSTTEYSTPFHGRKNGLSIAKRLFNLARRIKNSKKASFFYTKNTDKSK